MGSPNGIATLPRIKPGRRAPLAQVLQMQQIAFTMAIAAQGTSLSFAALVRAWCMLEDRRCRLRGIPLPGQLRPDLDPVQLARAFKRSQSRRHFEFQPQEMFCQPSDAPTAA